MRDLYHNIEVVEALNAQEGSTTPSGKDVDVTGCEMASFVLQSDGSNDIDWKLEEKDSGGSYSDVGSSDILGSCGTVTSEGVLQVGYIGNKDLVRMTITSNGGTTAFSGVAIKGGKRHKPVN